MCACVCVCGSRVLCASQCVYVCGVEQRGVFSRGVFHLSTLHHLCKPLKVGGAPGECVCVSGGRRGAAHAHTHKYDNTTMAFLYSKQIYIFRVKKKMKRE